jgi:hypothetical protein
VYLRHRVLRVVSLLCWALSALVIWSEVALASPRSLSPFGKIIQVCHMKYAYDKRCAYLEVCTQYMFRCVRYTTGCIRIRDGQVELAIYVTSMRRSMMQMHVHNTRPDSISSLLFRGRAHVT